MPESREMTLQEIMSKLPEIHSARREYEQLVSCDTADDISDPIKGGRAELRAEVERLRQQLADLREENKRLETELRGRERELEALLPSMNDVNDERSWE